MTGTPKVQRARRDPAEKAADALGVAERRVTKLEYRRDELTDELAAVQAECELAAEEAEYLAKSPHLTRKSGPQGAGDPS